MPENKWKVENGYMEVAPATGSIQTKKKFGDIQLHREMGGRRSTGRFRLADSLPIRRPPACTTT
jgi:hypothetical protein